MSHRILICTDLDRTLLPNGSQPESPEARRHFARLAAHPQIVLAYVSGRHQGLVTEAIQEYQLPVPDWVVGDVGTTVFRLEGGCWYANAEWQADIATDWRGSTAVDLRPLFEDLPDLRLQEESKQNRFKLSYYLPLHADVESLQVVMQRRLAAKQLAASLIYSFDEMSDVGLLDVLPARATKLHAVEFLMGILDIERNATVFAGDSGNDIPVLVSSIPSVLVANAAADVAEQARSQAQRQGNLMAFYHARGGLFGMNGNYSAGILEGVVHFHPQALNWMEISHEQ